MYDFDYVEAFDRLLKYYYNDCPGRVTPLLLLYLAQDSRPGKPTVYIEEKIRKALDWKEDPEKKYSSPIFSQFTKEDAKELAITEAKAKKLIKWLSRESDAFGYDIQSVDKGKTPRYIEVKATQRKVGDMDFYYTENEYETAKKFGQNYYIYIVYEILTPHPKVWIVKNPFDEGLGIKMKPVKYKVQLSTSK